MSTRALIAFASCAALAAVLVLSTWIDAIRADPAVGPTSASAAAPSGGHPEAPEATVRTPIAPRGRIDGSVVDTRGAPVDPGAGSVELRGPSDVLRLSTWSPDGSFAFDGLSSGPWSVRAVAPGWDEEVVRVELVAPNGSGRADFVLRRVRTVPMRLVDQAGRPLADALAANGLEPAHAGRIEIDAEGRSTAARAAWTFLGEGVRAVEIVEGSSPRVRLLSGNALLDEVHPEEGVAEIVLTADIERIRAQAAWITFELPESPPRSTTVSVQHGDRDEQVIRLAADARVGRIGVEPGPILFRVAAEGWRDISGRTRLAPGETRALGALTFEAECVLRGVARTSDGQPIGGPIAVRAAQDRAGRDSITKRTMSDVNGRFVVRGLGKGWFSVWCEWGGPTSTVELPCASELDVLGEFPVPNRARQGRR